MTCELFSFSEGKTVIAKLRINVKSLAYEAKANRREMRRVPPTCRGALRNHRVNRVRPESRTAQLALAFVRGVPYKKVERSCRVPPDAKQIAAKVSRCAYLPKCQEIVENWLRS